MQGNYLSHYYDHNLPRQHHHYHHHDNNINETFVDIPSTFTHHYAHSDLGNVYDNDNNSKDDSSDVPSYNKYPSQDFGNAEVNDTCGENDFTGTSSNYPNFKQSSEYTSTEIVDMCNKESCTSIYKAYTCDWAKPENNESVEVINSCGVKDISDSPNNCNDASNDDNYGCFDSVVADEVIEEYGGDYDFGGNDGGDCGADDGGDAGCDYGGSDGGGYGDGDGGDAGGDYGGDCGGDIGGSYDW